MITTVELVHEDGSSSWAQVNFPQGPSTFLWVNLRENEIREAIAKGESPVLDGMEVINVLYAFHGIVGGMLVYTRGQHPATRFGL